MTRKFIKTLAALALIGSATSACSFDPASIGDIMSVPPAPLTAPPA